MSGRIGINNRIISCIGVSIQALGVVGGLDYGVGLGEAAYVGVVVSGAVEVEASGGVLFLTGVFVISGVLAFAFVGGAVGVIFVAR